MRKTAAVVFVATIVCAALLPGGAQAAGSSVAGLGDSIVQCAPIIGPQWVFPPDSYTESDLYDASISSDQYESFVSEMTCSGAAPYIKQIIGETLPNTAPGTPNRLTVGPGFTCVAYPDKNGRAYAGSCSSGLALFEWNYNVQWHGVPDSSTGEGGVGVEPMGTIEYETTLRPLGNDQYQLIVQDASAIGAINAFTWSSPPGLTITAVTGSTGATCSLVEGSISCQGNLLPPQCLCVGDGGEATIDFTASGGALSDLDGHSVIHGFGWSYLHITQMTPVPYLIPDRPQKLKHPAV